jgi:serine-type D-Ala-D-Ala carboxypeptidase/endopeptidase
MNTNIHEILVRRIDKQKQALGIVVGVIEPAGRRVVAHGQLASGDPRPLDGDTIFEIGSISKVFTSLLLTDMVNRNEVKLDDPAGQYLPAGVRMPERGGKPITLLHLSRHTSGLPPLPGNFNPKDPRNPYADYSVDNLYPFLSGYELPRDPGSDFQYSNLGVGLLGHVLACRAGTDYESLIRTRITQPLGMPDTGITLSPSMQERMATGHTALLAPAPNWDFPTLPGAGGLRSSANDMLTFLAAVGQAEIGLGWFILPTDGREIAWHNGGTGGFRSFAGYDPKARTGVVVLSNAGGVDDIGFHILNPKLPLANPQPPQQHTEVPIDPKLLDNYTGRYQVTPTLVLEVTSEGGRIFTQGFAQANGQEMALPKFELFAEGEKTFFAKVADNQVTFDTGPDGRATSLILHRAGRDMLGPRLG